MINNIQAASFQKKITKNIIFAKSFTPFDFTKNMGQLAIKITYTDGDTDMLTTPPDEARKNFTNDKGDFANIEEYFQFIDWLKQEGISKS